MSELARITAHYLEQIVRRTNLTGFDDMRAELEAAAEQDEQRIASRFEDLEAKADYANDRIDQPDWRQR